MNNVILFKSPYAVEYAAKNKLQLATNILTILKAIEQVKASNSPDAFKHVIQLLAELQTNSKQLATIVANTGMPMATDDQLMPWTG